MLIKLNEINKFFESKKYSINELVDTLNRIGFEVESYKKISDASNLQFAYVKSVRLHKEKSNLKIAYLQIKNETFQVICGAPNLEQNHIVVYAPVGTTLPRNVHIKEKYFNNVLSQGMICSLFEIINDNKYLTKKDSEEILLFNLGDVDLKANIDPLQYLGIDDYVIDISILQGRSYANNYYWLAKELAAFDNQILSNYVDNLITPLNKANSTNFKLKIETSNDCTFLASGLIKIKSNHNLNLRTRLLYSLHEIKVDNPIIAISQYVTKMVGTPLMLFDQNLLATNALILDKNFSEKIILENDEEVNLWKDDLVITTNDNKIVGLAGIGLVKQFKILNETKEFRILYGNYNTEFVATTRNRLLYRDDFSKRSAWGFDLSQLYFLKTYDLFLTLIFKEGLLLEGYELLTLNLQKDVELFNFNFNILYSYLNITDKIEKRIAKKQAIDLFSKIGIKAKIVVQNEFDDVVFIKDKIRSDITTNACLVEEYTRLYDINKLEPKRPTSIASFNDPNPLAFENHFRNLISIFGFDEIKNYQLISKQKNDQANLFNYSNPVILNSSYNRLEDTMRQSLFWGLFEGYKINNFKNNLQNRFFEIAKISYSQTFKKHFAFIFDDQPLKNVLTNSSFLHDFYYLRYLFNLLLEPLGINDKIKFNKNIFHINLLNPNESLIASIDNQQVAIFGKIHPKLLIDNKITTNLYYCELNLTLLKEIIYKNSKVFIHHSFSELSNLSKDISIKVKKDIPIQNIIEEIKIVDKAITNVYLIDKFKKETEQILTFRFWLEQKKHNLDSTQINSLIKNILNKFE